MILYLFEKVENKVERPNITVIFHHPDSIIIQILPDLLQLSFYYFFVILSSRPPVI